MRTTIVAALLAFAIVAAGCDDSTPTGPTNDAAFSNFATSSPDAIRSQARDTCFRPPVHAAGTPVLTPSAPFTAAFDGTISLCSATTPPTGDNFPTTCAAPVECRSDRHQLRFFRR